MRHDDPTADQRLILRHRAGPEAEIHWDDRRDRRAEFAHRVMRLSVIVAVGVVVTGIALVVSQRLHPVRGTTAADAPAVEAVVPYSDPPWTVPLPTVPPTTAPPSATPSASPSAPPTSTTVKPRPTSPRPTVTRTVRTVAPAPTVTLLGPGGDDTVEAALTAYCVAVRGDLAVAVRSSATDGWDCRHAERATPIAMNAACRFFYGRTAWSKTLDDANPYSWRCFADGG